MEWTSAASTNPNLIEAIREGVSTLRDGLGAEDPDLVLAFLSGYPESETPRLPILLRDQLPFRTFLGCTAGGVIGGGE